MGRILVQYCLVKSALILAQNEIRLVSRIGSREWLYLFHTAIAQNTSELLTEILYNLFNKLIHINKFLLRYNRYLAVFLCC
jgi:hypothetical protein